MIEELPGGVTLVGTAHVAASSVAEVETAIRERRPARVLVELDTRRLEALRDPEAWRKTDIVRIIKEGKQHLFLLQLYLASVQANLGRGTGVTPGAELLRAVQVADEVGAEVVLIDRDITITLKRGFGALGLWQRLRLFYLLWMEVMTPADKDHPAKVDVEALLKSDAITQMTEEFARVAPPIKTALIDERDDFMAGHIAEQAAKGQPLVAVVGAGHLAGIRRRLDPPQALPDRATLLQLPKRRFPIGLVLSLIIPIALASYLTYLFLHGHTEQVIGILYLWIALHIIGAGLGAALARGHPAAIATGALAAPVTSFLPVGIKSGWLAGLVQAMLHKPKVEDFEAIKHIETFGQFWGNGIVRILTVTSLTILGSELASLVAGYIVVHQVLG